MVYKSNPFCSHYTLKIVYLFMTVSAKTGNKQRVYNLVQPSV